jgi:hypothetical protein
MAVFAANAEKKTGGLVAFRFANILCFAPRQATEVAGLV